ncbi:porin [Chelatococcus sp. SYSU_G07232]|uniref:Porin n=1 Tax=Chelatococcus albus TaxID=3047466 RepID=A0ABT7AF35_9HYPH|nr:porin [Chelatococcus sp. SYSU_G07232]MDJ1157966.1 porin [Chelatococcus sp. SYSU_G07232]
MVLLKHGLLVGTAGLVAAGAAGAADLPMKKAAPVEYVRVCSAQGEGFFYIPGTDTCLRIGGRLRAEVRYLEPGKRTDDAIGFRARARLNIDTRTATTYGTLRAFIRYEFTSNTGNFGADTTNLERAFIQFAGITAGRTQSFFDFYTNDYNFGAILVSDFSANALAYTATFGSGFMATLSLEDGNARRQIQNANVAVPPGDQNFTSGGERLPDVVGQLRVDQSWGMVQMSAALHQMRSTNFVPGFAPQPFVDTDYGFAVQGGLQLKLPMIASGDQLWLQGGYAEGAMSYLGLGNTSVGDITLNQTDVYVDGTGDAKRSKAWAVTALFLHYWTPQVRQAVFGSYGRIDYAASGSVVNAAGATTGFVDTTDWRIGTNVSWIPVSGFYIGVEALYRRVDPRGRVYANNDATGRLVGSADAIETRLRLQRDF